MRNVRFLIKDDIPGLNADKHKVIGGQYNDQTGVFITKDLPWIKHLRQLDDSIAEEIEPRPPE